MTIGLRSWPKGSMTAMTIAGPRRVEFATMPVPQYYPSGVLVRPTYVGLCGTDLELLHGTSSYLRDGQISYPLIFGHEWCGRVVAIGESVQSIAVGDRVVGHTMVSCGYCRMCQRSRRQFCQKIMEVGLYGLHGAAADYICVSGKSLTILPDDISDLSAVFVEPAVTVVGAFERVRCSFDDKVAVIGTGTIGLLAVQLAARLARSVDAIGVTAAGLEMALRSGARDAFCPEEAVRASYSLVIEASGAPEAFLHSLELAEPGGRVAIIGVSNEPVGGIIPGDIALRGIDIFGIKHGLDFYDRTIQLFVDGVLDSASLIAEVLALKEAARAFEVLEHGRSGPPKVLLSLDSGEERTVELSNGTLR